MSIGFWELILVAIIALIFINPKKLPETTYVIGAIIGNLNRKYQAVKKSFYDYNED